jgi:hydrophobe/amphiphile efflux-3 (HAE3) family protein
MQRLWSWLAVNLGRRAGAVSLVGLIVTVGLGFGITKLEFATGQDRYLNADEQVFIDNVNYQNLFGGQAMLTLITMDPGHTVDELFTPEGIATFTAVGDRLRAVDNVDGVIDPLSAMVFSSDLVVPRVNGCDVTASTASPECAVTARVADALGAIGTRALLEADESAKAVAAEAGMECPAEGEVPEDVSALDPRCQDVVLRGANLADMQARLLMIGEPALDNPAYANFILYDTANPDGGGDVRKALLPFFPDDAHALAVTRLGGNLSIEEEGAASDGIVEIAQGFQFENASVVTTGAPVLLDDINEYLRGGMVSLGAIALVVMALILIILTNLRWRLLPLLVVTIGIIWAFGLTGYAGIPLTLVTVAAIPVMLGVGIDFAVQMHSRIEEEVIIDRSPHPIQEAARQLGGPMLVATGAAAVSFLAILGSRTPMIRQFGLLLALGIVAICISSIVNPLAILGIREYRRPTEGRTWTDGHLARFVNGLGSIPARFAVVLVVAAVAVFVGGVFVEGRLKIQTDPVRWIDRDSQLAHDIGTVEQEVGASLEMGVFVVAPDHGSTFTDETVTYVDDLTRNTLAEFPERLLVGSGIVPMLSDLTTVEGAAPVTPSAALVSEAWEIAPADVQTTTASADGSAMNVVFMTAKGSLEDNSPVVDHVDDHGEGPNGVRSTPSGLAVVGVGLVENLASARILLTYLAIALVLVWLTIAFRSLVSSLLALTPVLTALGTLSLVAYFGGFELSPMTSVGGPLVVAACTEFTTLILYRYLQERRRGLEPQGAMRVAGARTGRAFVVSALTTMAGVAVISLSSLPLVRDFGITVAIVLSVALLAALVVLPPLVIWADRRGWVSKELLDREEAPFLDVPRSAAEAESTMAARPTRR